MTNSYQTAPVQATSSSQISVPDEVTVALTQIASSATEGLLALAVGTGLQVLDALLEQDATRLCGPRGKHNPERAGYRHGAEEGQVTLGGRRVPVSRPRVRAADGSGELALASYALFSQTEVLGRLAPERMLAGLSTRRYRAGLEPVGQGVAQTATGTSRAAVSRRFVAQTQTALAELLARPLDDLDLVALMGDGVGFAEHCLVVALGVGIDGVKHPLALVEGSTENATLVTDLLVGVRARGLDTTRPILVVIDGAKALRRAVLDVFDHPVLQRCQLHKVRNVTDRLPERLRTVVERRMRAAYHARSAVEHRGRRPARRARPGARQDPPTPVRRRACARAWPRRLPCCGLRCHLPWPGPCVRPTRSSRCWRSAASTPRTPERWRDGQMALRWCAAGMVEAGKQFRKVNGLVHLPALRQALDADIAGLVTPTEYNKEDVA